MSNLPLWHDDILAFYPALIERLKSVPAIKKVCEAKELEDLDAGRVQTPLDGAVYVVLDSIAPTDGNARGREQLMQIGVSIILTKRDYNPVPRLDGVGATITAICKALQGFEAKKDGRHLTLSPFVQNKGIAIRYSKGFAFFPMHFSTTVAIMT